MWLSNKSHLFPQRAALHSHRKTSANIQPQPSSLQPDRLLLPSAATARVMPGPRLVTGHRPEWLTAIQLAVPALPMALSTLLKDHFPGLAISYPEPITLCGTRKLQGKLYY